MGTIIVTVIKKLFMSMITEAVLKELIIYGLETAAKSSSNKIDDKVLDIVKKAWDGESEDSSEED